ncbi:hypothetical protein B5S28_g926 [[Candida] boidinii]|nr:hypothetical protein B5S28_g926 [[Candida] boidinii]GME93655.1 unnamed protein product [[Candida] boidinii]
MGKVLQLLSHPLELKAALQLKFFRVSLYPIDLSNAPQTEKDCYDLLTLTSRSFVSVIKELNPELRNVIMVFYLVLRALDTVEDDMTLDRDLKIKLLRSFDSKLLTKDWTFTQSGPNEKDRDVLVKFDVILAEYHKLKPLYQDIIKDITKKMGNGMADYIVDEEFNLNGVKTIKDYDLYCHYVAGLVGEGLTKISVTAEFGKPSLIDDMYLSESMGLFLQKTNIIRDYKEDLDDGRSFWPEEIWGKYSKKLVDFTTPEHETDGVHCITELVLNSMSHIKDCLSYLSQIYDYSTFSFCAIPQVMAIATLAEVFQNRQVFHKNVKIRRGTTCELILKSRTYEDVLQVFSKYIKIIHHKCPVSDPHYLQIGIICGEIEQFIEQLHPNPAHIPEGCKPLETQDYLNATKKIQLDEQLADDLKFESMKTDAILSSVILSSLCLFSIAYFLFSVGGIDGSIP